jgi:hypothetical protein
MVFDRDRICDNETGCTSDRGTVSRALDGNLESWKREAGRMRLNAE